MYLLAQLPPLVQIALIGLIASALLYGIGALAAEARKHTKNKAALTVIDIVERAARSAVAYVDQRFVAQLKANGQLLTQEEAEDAAKLALQLIKDEIGRDVLAQFTKQIKPETPDAALAVKVEQAVLELKATKAAAPVNVVGHS